MYMHNVNCTYSKFEYTRTRGGRNPIKRLPIPGQGVGEKDEEDVTTALTIDVPKVAFLIIYIYWGKRQKMSFIQLA